MEMKFSEKFKKNKGEAAAPEAAQDSGKKKHKPDPKKLVGTISKKHIKNGSYSVAMAAVFIVIVVVINMIVGAIPSKYSQLDVSSSKLYTIGDETKKVLKTLDKDVTIYQIAASGSEDDTISNLLSRYKDESKHIKVEVKDPVVNPKFASEYTTDDLASNSLIVVCGDRNKVINYNDMYSSSVDYNTWQQTTTGFDGEGQITSAIGYVTSEDLPIMYTLSGHGEKDLDSSFKEDIQKANIDIKELNLLTEGKVPDDADCLMIVSPTSDISEEEQKMLANYVTDGGKLLVMAGPTEEGTLKNLYGLLEAYGVEASDGVVIEADREHYAFQAPYVLLPDMAGSDITDSLIEENYFPIMPISQGMKLTGSSGNGTVTELLTTSDAAFSKIAGYSLSTYEKEEDDIDGPFSVALSVEANSGGKIVWFASSSFLEDMYNAYSSGANGDMAMNALSSLVGESEAMAIRSKSLNYNYLTISASTSSLLKVMMIGVFPLLYLGIGICVVLTRRKKQNETV